VLKTQKGAQHRSSTHEGMGGAALARRPAAV
jgi:hypothetical protein